MRSHLCVYLFGLATQTAALADAQGLTVVLDDVKHANGQLHVGLYRDADSFRKEGRAAAVRIVPATSGRVSVAFDAQPPGRYAVMAWHDEDGDGQFKRRFGMFPVEGYGLSNNPDKAGPPAFDDSAFDLPAASGVVVRMRY